LSKHQLLIKNEVYQAVMQVEAIQQCDCYCTLVDNMAVNTDVKTWPLDQLMAQHARAVLADQPLETERVK
jgi:hypothetical protein